MYILAIDTTGRIGSVALINEEGNILGEETCSSQMSHLKDLVPMVQRLLKNVGVDKENITVIAPSVGPGSFTGIRIGVATARALCQGLNISKALAVPTLQSFLYCDGALEQKKKGNGERPVICPIINARRGQVYGLVENCMEAGPYMLTDVLEAVKKQVLSKGRKVYFMGDGIDAYRDEIIKELGDFCTSDGCFEEMVSFAPADRRYQDAKGAARLAYHMLKAGKNTVNYWDVTPDYMRKAEAEQKLEAGQLPICKGPKQE